jgi:hypothetical protein
MRVWHHGNSITVPFFDEAWDFVDEVQAQSPYVLVSGEWPMIHPDSRAGPGVETPGAPV